MIELNSKLLDESSKPFHSYLLISGSSRYLIDQAKAFSSNLLFNSTDILEHPDIRVVTSENINTLGVDDIRRVINDESIYPIEGKYKIFIFPPTKSLTEEASNALLKTLEEPSKSNIFIITSNGRHWSHSKDDSIKNILPNPFILKDMDKAIDRTVISIINKEIKFEETNSYDIEGSLNLRINKEIECLLEWAYDKTYKNEIIIEGTKSSLSTEYIFSKDSDYLPYFNIIEKNKTRSIIKTEKANHFELMLNSFYLSSKDLSSSQLQKDLILDRSLFLKQILKQIRRK